MTRRRGLIEERPIPVRAATLAGVAACTATAQTHACGSPEVT